MFTTKDINRILAFSVLPLCVRSVVQWAKVPLGPTALWWTFEAVVLVLLLLLWPKQSTQGQTKMYSVRIVNLFVLMLGISAVYGFFFQAENYWDMKNLVNNLLTFSMVPLVIYSYSRPVTFAQTLRTYLQYSPLLIVLMLPLLTPDGVGKIMVPYTILALTLVYVDKPLRYMVLIAFALTVLFGHDSRSDILRFLVCLFLGASLFLPLVRRYLGVITKTAFVLMTVMPFILLALAVSGVFNIFQLEETLGLEGKVMVSTDQNLEGETSALSDTRSFIYIEEAESAILNDYAVFGRSIARGYDTEFFASAMIEDYGGDRNERAASEVSILNIFNYFGIVGVLIYMLMLFSAAYKAIWHSDNKIMPVIGIYVMFRWCYSWIEDFTRFDTTYYFLWVLVALCFSPVFRSMTDSGFREMMRQTVPSVIDKISTKNA